ncbi:hypothetical protein WMY93_030016 [Mugilogobius chulae]|uniref:Ig-like domain-containing protein n=1 Tax=Mugilogobius chulae TaxID=88201 RepID=A0AAW0MWL1_9GOBI
MDLHQDTANITERNSDGTFTTKITQNITLTDAHDGLMIKCDASYPVSGGGIKMSDSNVTLSVSYGPKNTSAVVSPSGSLSAGQSVTLSCSSRAKPPVQHFTWFRHSSQGPVKVTEGQNYTFNICEEEEYYCVASNQHGNGSSSDIRLQITDAPWSPSITVSGDQTETEVVTITCSAVTPCPLAPPKLTWNLHQDTANITERNSDGTFTTKIRQNLTLTDAHDGLMIKCNASYPVSGGGFKMSDNIVTLSVSYGPKNTSAVVSPSGSLSAGQSVTLSCSSRAKPPVQHFTWFRNSSQVPVNVSEGQTYTFNICEEEKYYCVASNQLGNGSSSCINLEITDAPWSPSITVSGDQTETEVVTITCSAVTPCPLAPPKLTWDLHQDSANITERNSDGTFTTKITQNITLTDAHDGLMIKCNASYPVSGGGIKMSDSNVTLSVSYGPKNTSAVVSPSGSLSAGQSVTLSCSSRAKPPVQHFTWFRHSSQGPVNVTEEGQTYTFNIYVPWIPSIKVSGGQTETEVVTVTCSAVTPCPLAPPKLTWDLQQDTANITESVSKGTSKITQNITLTDGHDGKIIKCSAAYPVTGAVRTTESNITLNVTYGPKNTSAVVSPSGSLSAGQSVTLSCSSRAKPPVQHFTWFRNSSQGPVNVSKEQAYRFNFTEDGEYYCEALNTLGNEISPTISLKSITGQSGSAQSPREEMVQYGEIDFSKLSPKEVPKIEEEGTIYSQVTMSLSKATEEETIHYGETEFSNLSPKEVPKTEQEETVYSQVQVSKPADTTMGHDETLHANVKK